MWCLPIKIVAVCEGHSPTDRQGSPLLVDETIHYRILKLFYGAKNQRGTCVPTGDS